MARDLLHDGDGALAHERDRDRVGAHAVACHELTVRRPTLSALELPRCEGLAITSYAQVLQGVN